MKTERITFRVDKKLKSELSELAYERGETLSEYINDILTIYSNLDIDTLMKFHEVDLHKLNVFVKTNFEKREEVDNG